MKIVPVIHIPTGKIANTAKGTALNQKFVKLGNLKGKTYAQIASVAGNCNSVNYQENATVRQWYSGNYRIILIFDKNDVCVRIHSETRV